MKQKIIPFFLLLSFTGNLLLAQVKLSSTDMIKIDKEELSEKNKRLQSGDATLVPAYNQLLKDADKALNYKPVTVMNKTDLPPSGNKHDYMSIAPYWWPNPSSPNGLPYIRKDGVVNPEIKNFPDKANMPVLCETINLLSLAYYFSNNEKYATHAGKLIRVWFLDTATKMNPHLNYGQAVKGVTTGRAEGLIDTRHFILVIDAIELLQNSSFWTSKDQIGIKKWFAEFLNWMQTSEIGRDEMNAKNNHGVWFDAQSLSFAIFAGNLSLTNEIISRAAKRLDQQMDANGFFPLEMDRTTSLHYTVFTMNAFVIIAQLAEKSGTDFWSLKTSSGKSFKKCFEVMLPFITGQKKWEGQQIKPFDRKDAVPLLLRAGKKYNCNSCSESIKDIEGVQFDKLLLNLL